MNISKMVSLLLALGVIGITVNVFSMPRYNFKRNKSSRLVSMSHRATNVYGNNHPSKEDNKKEAPGTGNLHAIFMQHLGSLEQLETIAGQPVVFKTQKVDLPAARIKNAVEQINRAATTTIGTKIRENIRNSPKLQIMLAAGTIASLGIIGTLIYMKKTAKPQVKKDAVEHDSTQENVQNSETLENLSTVE